MQSVMSHSFSKVPLVDIPRSSFDRSYGLKTTFDSGYLIPVLYDIALPGDTFNLRMAAFARLATPYKPLMDNMYMDSFFFAVPMRLIWNNFQKFMGEQTDPGDSTDFTIPQMTGPDVASGGIAVGSLSDYFSLPTGPLNGGGATTGLTFNSWFHRAYNLVWNEWFRDQNLQDSVVVDKDDGPDTYTDYVLLRRGKRHDYFTSALPWPQKGPDVLLPLGTTAPIVSTEGNIWLDTTDQDTVAVVNPMGGRALEHDGVPGTSNPANVWFANTGVNNQFTALQVDLTEATAATINAIREAFQLQRMYERDARGGTRYVEIIKSHFGVSSPDARLQRPEYLGGGSSPVNMHPVAQTSASPATPTGINSQGNLAAFATASFAGHGFTKSFTEHTLIIGLVSVRADLTYQYGAHRFFNIRTKFDLYWPALSHLGEQEILNREIYCDLADGTGDTQKDGVFGYQERYAEYRYKPSMITGLMRSEASGTLDIWHLSQEFGSTQPTLDSTFIQEDPPVDRVIQVPTEPHFILDAFFNYKCARPMPVYGVPGMVDHF